MNFKHTTVQETEARRTVLTQSGEIDIVDNKTPLDELIEKEEQGKSEIREAQIDALSRFMLFLLSDAEPLKVALRVYLMAYTLRPSLINNITLSEIAQRFNTTKQNCSKKLINLNDSSGVRARTRKKDSSREIYRQKALESWEKRKSVNH